MIEFRQPLGKEAAIEGQRREQGKQVEGPAGSKKGLLDKSAVMPLTSAGHYAELRDAWPE